MTERTSLPVASFKSRLVPCVLHPLHAGPRNEGVWQDVLILTLYYSEGRDGGRVIGPIISALNVIWLHGCRFVLVVRVTGTYWYVPLFSHGILIHVFVLWDGKQQLRVCTTHWDLLACCSSLLRVHTHVCGLDPYKMHNYCRKTAQHTWQEKVMCTQCVMWLGRVHRGRVPGTVPLMPPSHHSSCKYKHRFLIMSCWFIAHLWVTTEEAKLRSSNNYSKQSISHNVMYKHPVCRQLHPVFLLFRILQLVSLHIIALSISPLHSHSIGTKVVFVSLML